MNTNKTPESPMMAEYRRIKSELPDHVLLVFQVGDFYELFFEDAQIALKLLNLVLTKRGTTPMCGFPVHASASYFQRLVNQGKPLAICDKFKDDPGRREITRRIDIEKEAPPFKVHTQFQDGMLVVDFGPRIWVQRTENGWRVYLHPDDGPATHVMDISDTGETDVEHVG